MAEPRIEVREIFSVFGKRWKLIVLNTVLISAITAVVSFFLPKWYTGISTLLPPRETSSGFGLSALTKGLSLPGITFPGTTTPSDVLLAILRSKTVGEQMVGRFNLMKVYKAKDMDGTLYGLRKHSKFSITDEGIIRISVEARSPQLASDMANSYVEFLDKFNRENTMSEGKRSRLFIEKRLAETTEVLKKAEEALKSYQELHKAAPISSELAGSIEASAELMSRKIGLEVKLGVLRSYLSEKSDQVMQVKAELAQLEKQLLKLPELGLEFARLIRDVKVQESVYALLVSQYEEAKIQESKDTQTVEVLDKASPPIRRSSPKRKIMVLVAGALSFAGSLALAFGLEYLGRAPLE
ncbi:MAG: GNVR domain-containing protein [Candidatus Eisenbacteria bacterium]|nr:GNVR domain-containing protein [Candidatus Eisenbacteria bacterium]